MPAWPDDRRQTLARWIATLGGVGYAARAPGTMGTLATLPLWLLWQDQSGWIRLATFLLLVGVGIWAAEVYARQQQHHDPREVVVDEAAGLLLTLATAPLTWFHSLTGFVLFRLFDILKPWPVHRAERLPGGLGIMADDLVAGLLAWSVLNITSELLERMGYTLP